MKMYILKIPEEANKLDFVYTIVYFLMDNFKKYNFVNCTDSPIDELEYIKIGELYYRFINRQNIKKIVNEDNYNISYRLDSLHKQGYTLIKYIEACLLFELGEIRIIIPNNEKDLIQNIKISEVLLKLLICPDGLNEIQVIGKSDVFNKVVECLKELQF